MHAKTVAKLNALTVRLASYTCGDVRDYLREVVPASAPVAMFPPFYSGDYEAQFAAIDTYFDWPAPSYDLLDEAGKEQLIAAVLDRPHWILGLHVARKDLRPWLRGVVQTSNRGLPIYVYASAGTRRVVRPAQPIAAIPMPKLGPSEELGDRMALHPLSGGQFAAIRSQFMSKSILPGSPLLACGVSVDGRIIGAFAYLPPKYEPTCAYLMSDFPVSWTRYRQAGETHRHGGDLTGGATAVTAVAVETADGVVHHRVHRPPELRQVRARNPGRQAPEAQRTRRGRSPPIPASVRRAPGRLDPRRGPEPSGNAAMERIVRR